MGSFGDRLRRERELRAVTLEEIAEATKIGTRSLKALEDEQFDILPGGIFNKGFVRAYAKYLGIDEEQAVADYAAALAKASENGTVTPSDEAVVASIAKKRSEPEKRIGVDEGGSKIWVALAVIALLAAGGYSSWKYYEQRKTEKAAAEAAVVQAQTPAQVPVQQDSQQVAVQEIPTATEATTSTGQPSVPAPSVTTAPATNVTATPASEFTLQLHTVEDVWVSVQADGKTVLESLLTPDTDRTITAKDKVVMKVGKPNALQVSFNGTPVGPLGPPDKTVTKTFTTEGMQQ